MQTVHLTLSNALGLCIAASVYYPTVKHIGPLRLGNILAFQRHRIRRVVSGVVPAAKLVIRLAGPRAAHPIYAAEGARANCKGIGKAGACLNHLIKEGVADERLTHLLVSSLLCIAWGTIWERQAGMG